jgi:hypothetical protein
MTTAQLDPHVCPKNRLPLGRRPFLRFYHSLTFWTIAVVVIGVAWRTARFLLRFPIWGDESFVCVNFPDNTFSGLIGPLRVGQICPLTFLWSELAMYRWLGPSELVMRLLPYLAGLCALALFWPLCRRVLPPLAASLAMALLAVSYYPVRHAVEVKPYSEDLVMTLGLLLPAAAYTLDPARSRWLVLLTLLVPLAVVSSYPAVLTAGSISMVLLPVIWRRVGNGAKCWFLLFNLFLATAFLGNYLLVGKPQLSPHETHTNNAFNSTWQEWFPEPNPASFLLWFLKAHTGNMFAYPIGGPNFASSLTTLLCLLGAWSWWRDGNRQILALLVWPFVLSMLAAILHKYPYGGSARLDQHLAPEICLFAGNGIAALVDSITRRRRHKTTNSDNSITLSPCHPVTISPCHLVSLSPLLFLVAFGAIGTFRDMVKPFKTTAELWNRTFVQELMARAGPRDRIIVFHAPSEVRPGLEWYFRQHDYRVCWRGDVDWDRFDSGESKIWCVQMSFVDKPAATSVPDAVVRSGRAAVLVDHYQSTAPPEHGDDPEVAEVYCYAHAAK